MLIKRSRLYSLLSLYSTGLNNPYSLDVYGSKLYWVSLTDSELRYQDKNGRGVNATLQTGLFNVKDVKMYHEMRYNTSSKSFIFRRRTTDYVVEPIKTRDVGPKTIQSVHVRSTSSENPTGKLLGNVSRMRTQN